MSESSCVVDHQPPSVEQSPVLSEQELNVLRMFRSISGQHQRDIVRMLEVLVLLEE